MQQSDKKTTLALLLFFLSGVSALMYEVLWLRQLGLLFGNSSHAMATTLAAFFLGLGVGGYRWGVRVNFHNNPLFLYGLLEIGAAFCALGYFLLIKFYAWIYPLLFSEFGDHAALFLLVKFSLSMLVLFPPAYFMGGTLPVISRYVVESSTQMGRRVALLYAVNTLGAVLGVFLAGFYLPSLLGYASTYWLAIAITVVIAAMACGNARPIAHKEQNKQQSSEAFVAPEIQFIAFISGLLMLALQVLWSRMFAQVLQNSVYTFALILMVFLFCLSLGSLVAHWIIKKNCNADVVLFFSIVAGALLVSTSPFVFIYWTDGLHFIGADEGWQGYLLKVLSMAIVIMGPPLILLGMIFPLLIKLSENNALAESVIVGKLLAINTAGAISGSLLAGFVILDQLGLWSGIRLQAVVFYLLALAWLNFGRLNSSGFNRSMGFILPTTGLLLTVSLWDTGKLPLVRIDPVADHESILQVWEGSAGTVAVVRDQKHIKLKVNNYYTLGGTSSYQLETLQARLPLLLHPQPETVYLLGLGTGITAGAALSLPIKKLVVTELLQDVVRASDKYFSDYTNGLFFDPRVKIIAEDGRNYLRGTDEQFDVIISDLFVPWKAGSGNLYSLQHYQTVAQRLHTDGLFMQWLPSYQLSEAEFKVIVRTMLTVFPQLTVWRGDFSALKPVIGLLGQKQQKALSSQSTQATLPMLNDEMPLLTYYVGNMQHIKQDFDAIELNTDDKPIIEFRSPISQRLTKSGDISWLAGEQMITFMQQFDISNDTFIAEIEQSKMQLPAAGLHLQAAQLYRYQGKLTKAKQQIALFQQKLSKKTQ